MYELSRIRLYSIGPAGARYADTVLDLRGVGEPVPHPAPTQAEFFEDEPTGPPRRPAPAGVLFLENGGGKSVLLKLIFSVMLPGHRNTLGGASSGVLRKFLLADDCGHVALEWQHTQTGECVVVGKVSEWRGRQVSNDPRKFAEAWYSFRPGPGLSLDSLPVAEATSVRPPVEGASGAQGRRRTMKGFRDSLTEAGKAYPHLEVYFEEIHDRWNEHLTELGLDPELFRYQREMNADEGEAAGLFAVKKDSDFTDLLLRAVTDTRDTDGLADLVHGFGNKLGRRAELMAERDFTAGSVDLLTRIVEAAGARSRLRDVHAGAERRTRTLARRLSARAAEDRGRAADLAQQVTAAAHQVTAAESARTRSAAVSAELAYRHASLALTVADKAAAAQRRELLEARTLHSAWQAAENVLRHRAAADRSARVAAAILEAERDAAPALAARATAAGELVRALHTAAEHGERLANEEEERSAALQATGEASHRDATAAATAAQRARSEAEHLRSRLAEVQQETAEAVRAGWLDDTAPDADPARAALAATDAEKTAVAAWDESREAARAAAEAAREAAAAESRAELTAARAADAADAAEAAHEAEHRAAASLATAPRLAELLGLPSVPDAFLPHPRAGARADATVAATTSGTVGRPGAAGAQVPGHPGTAGGEGLTVTDLDRNADDLRTLLTDGVAAAERQLFELRTAAADDARILGALGDGGLLPPGPDVLATVEYLGEHGIPALPGWRYLAQSVDPADHAAVLAARPELVDGVVITDPDTHGRAREVLSGAALLPRSTVAVGTAAALLAPATPAEADSAVSSVFIVSPNPAMHDEGAADEERQALRARAAARDTEIRDLAARLGGDRELAARLGSWRTGCPPGRLTELAEAAAAARMFAEEADAELVEARTVRAEADEAAADASRVREERQDTAQRARRVADALAGLAFRLRERAGWQAKLRELADDAAESEARAEVCLDRARAADEDRRAAQRAADDARRTARALRAERAEIAGAPDQLPDSDGDTPGRHCPTCARPTARPPSSTRRSASAPTCAPSRPAPRATRAPPSPNSTASPTRSVPGPPSSSKAPTAPTAPPGRPRPPAPRHSCRCWRPARPPRASSSAGCAARPNGTPPARGRRTPNSPRSSSPRTSTRPRPCCVRPPPNSPPTPRPWRAPGPPTRTCCAPTAPPRTAPAASTRRRRCSGTCCATTPTRTTSRSRYPTRAPWRRPASPPPRPAAPCAAARQSSRPPIPRCARRATSWSGTPTPPATSRYAPPRASRSGNCPPPRCPSTRRPGPRPSRRGCASSPTNWRSWSATATASSTACAASSNRPWPRSAPRSLSQLPEGLGEWSGQEFLRIRFEEPDQATLTERLGEVIDEATRTAVKKNSSASFGEGRRDGMSLLLRGVQAALEPKGISVEILKPDAVLRAERVPVGQMGDVFSGGQLLTAAIALYCTMAALRSNDRGRDKHRHAGTLFLDNPIGRANATYLLELQRAVSDALGVQLLYTTGLFDTTALAEFPLVIRLRNDADLRAGLKYISVEEHLRPGLPQQSAEAETVHGEITATRMFRRSGVS